MSADWEYSAPDNGEDPNSRWFVGIFAYFRDESRVVLTHIGLDEKERPRYIYLLTDPAGRTIEAGEDLRSDFGDSVNHCRALAAWTNSARIDAKTFQSTMDGTAMQEWAFLHDDELAELSYDLSRWL
jgi:hypothetical protein